MEMPGPPQLLGGAQVFKWCSAVSYFSTLLGSIIGAGRLSFRVRDGTGRFPTAMAAVTLCKFVFPPFAPALVGRCIWWWGVVFIMFMDRGCEFVMCCKFSAG